MINKDRLVGNKQTARLVYNRFAELALVADVAEIVFNNLYIYTPAATHGTRHGWVNLLSTCYSY
jgi:hypothetical protein